MYSSNSIFALKATFLQAVLEMTIEIHFVHHLRHATVHRSYNRKSLASKQRSKTPRLHSKRRRGGHIFDSFSLTSKNQLVTLTPHKARRRRRVKSRKSIYTRSRSRRVHVSDFCLITQGRTEPIWDQKNFFASSNYFSDYKYGARRLASYGSILATGRVTAYLLR